MADDIAASRADPGPHDDAALESWLARLSDRLEIDRDRRRDVIDELRSHVLDAADLHAAQGLTRADGLRLAWTNLGPEDHLVDAINGAHAGGAMAEAVVVAGLPVALALVLRWGILTLDGRTPDWGRLATTVPFGVFALAVLIAPAVTIGRRRFALASWVVFWLLTLLLLAGA
jgi:hypothetical protein